jgi:methylenetetrahydrofolate reductase (NADPH)
MVQRLSFEFFPPNTERGRANLHRTRTRLAAHTPEFYSVTYGAGGSTRDRTFDAVAAIAADATPVAPHLSIGNDGHDTLRELLDRYRDLGINRIVALRGDIPSGMGNLQNVRYAAELVELIRSHSGNAFHVEVAAYPETHPDAPSPAADLDFFQAKINAGADSAITQYFFNADAYFDFVDRCRTRRIDAPIVPGIMPITNFANLVKFSDNCGAEIPRWIRLRLEALQDDPESLKQFGTDIVTELCSRLLAGGAPGLHFYTLNLARPSLAILDNLEG